MDDEPVLVAERGLLAVSDDVWNLAAHHGAVIVPLTRADTTGLTAMNAAVAELGVSPCAGVPDVARWRDSEGVVSDLIPGKSSGGRGGGNAPTSGSARQVCRCLARRIGARHFQPCCDPNTE